MPGFVDSHAHFEKALGSGDLEAMLDRAVEAGVEQVLAVGGNPGLNAAAIRAAELRPRRVRTAIGLDRDQAVDGMPVEELASVLDHASLAAIGETGLDYHYSSDTAKPQQQLFETMLQLASTRQLPVVIHSREADEDTLAMLRQHARNWTGNPERIGVLHCFTGSKAFARKLLDLGFYISFSGIVTFAGAQELRQTARYVPLDRLLIETDTPYLAPVPRRGHSNEPAWVVHTAEKLSEVREESLTDLAACTKTNACFLFGFENCL